MHGVQKGFKIFEFRVMVETTFASVAKRMGLKSHLS